MDSSNNKIREEILVAVSISLGALFFATVFTLIIAKYYKQIRSFCCPMNENESSNNNNATWMFWNKSPKEVPVIPYSKLAERRKEACTVQSISRFPPAFMTPREDDFTIPGRFYPSAVQPELKAKQISESSSRHSSVSSSHESPASGRRYNKSTTSLPANFSPIMARKLTTIFRHHSVVNSSDEGENEGLPSSSGTFLSTEDIRPELYNISRQKTVGVGNMGRLQISLQYEDKSRKKLDIFLKDMMKLQTSRPDITSVYASVVLLPDREAIFTTKQHELTKNLVLDEKFVFSSRPMNRDFESKTALFLIHYTDRASKDIIYGEARLPLLCREIYSQVLTDVTLNIKTASMQSEFGDLLLQLTYSESNAVHVMVKMIKVPSSMSLENMSVITVKCYLKKFGARVGKKTSLARSTPNAGAHVLELNGECKFKIPRDSFMDCDVTCVVNGRHKIMGKKLHLGKVMLGASSKDETGVAHWKYIHNSPGIAWTVWHPIYSS